MSSDSNTSKPFELKFLKNLKSSNKSHGYLVCPKCYGYYQLKKNELPTDFEECECGTDLEFYENIDNFAKNEGINGDISECSPNVLYDDYKELQEIVNVLKNKAEKRKEFFEELSTRIETQEEILNDIKFDEWRLWDTIEEKSLSRNIKGQKLLVENVIEQEDNFLSHVKKQRSKAENIEKKSNIYSYAKIAALLIVMIIIVLGIFFLIS